MAPVQPLFPYSPSPTASTAIHLSHSGVDFKIIPNLIPADDSNSDSSGSKDGDYDKDHYQEPLISILQTGLYRGKSKHHRGNHSDTDVVVRLVNFTGLLRVSTPHPQSLVATVPDPQPEKKGKRSSAATSWIAPHSLKTSTTELPLTSVNKKQKSTKPKSTSKQQQHHSMLRPESVLSSQEAKKMTSLSSISVLPKQQQNPRKSLKTGAGNTPTPSAVKLKTHLHVSRTPSTNKVPLNYHDREAAAVVVASLFGTKTTSEKLSNIAPLQQQHPKPQPLLSKPISNDSSSSILIDNSQPQKQPSVANNDSTDVNSDGDNDSVVEVWMIAQGEKCSVEKFKENDMLLGLNKEKQHHHDHSDTIMVKDEEGDKDVNKIGKIGVAVSNNALTHSTNTNRIDSNAGRMVAASSSNSAIPQAVLSMPTAAPQQASLMVGSHCQQVEYSPPKETVAAAAVEEVHVQASAKPMKGKATKPNIHPNDPWEKVYKEMKAIGWSYFSTSKIGYPTYLYTAPPGVVLEDGEEYVSNKNKPPIIVYRFEKQMMRYAAKHYKWKCYAPSLFEDESDDEGGRGKRRRSGSLEPKPAQGRNVERKEEKKRPRQSGTKSAKKAVPKENYESDVSSSDSDVDSTRKKMKTSSNQGVVERTRKIDGFHSFNVLEPWPNIKPKKKMLTICKIMIIRVERLDYKKMFHKPVMISYPDLADQYLKIIKDPMDLKTMRSNLRKYQSIQEMQEDLILIFDNCFTFNSKMSFEYNYAGGMFKQLRKEFEDSCVEENVALPENW
mmetsp:Transcript_53502/g.64442  ORF Transcript_53502/g.64442 Transcript_53502/m.64442 type:complete len:778 (+) Transcript_53502:223-2556(+)